MRLTARQLRSCLVADALFSALREHCLYPARVVLETGTLSAWLARGLEARGLAVALIDARQAHAVLRLQHNKTDANDAAVLADLARTGFYRRVAVKSVAAQHDRVLLKARTQVMRQRRDLENTLRGLLASLGHRLPKGVGKFARRVEAVLSAHPELVAALAPLLSARAAMEGSLAALDKVLRARVMADAECRLLMTMPGLGPVTALAYVATIDDAQRFARSRAVGAYVGLTSRRYESGETCYGGRISKHGDALLRSLLIVVRRGHPLKDRARKLRKRSSHKKACVALARKLAVILHRMLITGEPFRWPAPAKVAGA